MTALSMPAAAAAPPSRLPDVQLTVDRPFAFAVVHTPTGVPLFMGQVADPSAR